MAVIRRALAAHTPLLLPAGARTRAAVALILGEGPSGPEILFIERASHDGDPWSGDLGFPGGKVETADDSPRRAAERETLEEIGLDLNEAEYLGRLDDIAGAHLPIVVSCFVYAARIPETFSLSDEVVKVFRAPLERLFDPKRHAETTVFFRGETLRRPAIDLLGPGRQVLWGITYRLVRRFLEILESKGRDKSGWGRPPT